MNFDHSDKTKELIARVEKFMDENVYGCRICNARSG